MILMRDGGIVGIYTLTNTAEPGFKPLEKLEKVAEFFFAFRTGGVTRRYAAKGANAEYDFVIRCLNTVELPTGAEYAVLEDGRQFRIDVAEPLFDEDALDLTLVRLEDYYDVPTE